MSIDDIPLLGPPGVGETHPAVALTGCHPFDSYGGPDLTGQ